VGCRGWGAQLVHVVQRFTQLLDVGLEVAVVFPLLHHGHHLIRGVPLGLELGDVLDHLVKVLQRLLLVRVSLEVRFMGLHDRHQHVQDPPQLAAIAVFAANALLGHGVGGPGDVVVDQPHLPDDLAPGLDPLGDVARQGPAVALQQRNLPGQPGIAQVGQGLVAVFGRVLLRAGCRHGAAPGLGPTGVGAARHRA
jgi:hypothetical protein